MLIKAGVDGKPTVFLFSDNQIKEESFVEDVNMILNTGDVPNIFPADEKAEVIDKMQTVARVEVGTTSSPHPPLPPRTSQPTPRFSLPGSRPSPCPASVCAQ